MRLVYFNDFQLGVLKGDHVVDVSSLIQDVPHVGPHDLISGVIERFADYRTYFENAVATSTGVPVSGVRLRPPLPRPVNIVCMAGTSWENGTLKEPLRSTPS